MKFTQIPTNTFQELQLNAGILVKEFNPSTGTVSSDSIVGATSGGVAFTATPTYSDFGEDIDNCPKNTKELKQLDSWEVALSGTFVSVSADLVKTLVGAADAEGTKVTPRNDLKPEDFADIWWVGDYSDKNDATGGGFMAIHVINALSTDGFALQSTDKAKGTFAFNMTGHYSIAEQDKPPFEIYVKAGTNAA